MINFEEPNNEFSKEQKLIDGYNERFRERADNFQLPQIKFTRSFEKAQQKYHELNNTFFVAIPVKNQELIIISMIEKLICNMNNYFTIGLLFDNCDDLSENFCIEYFEKNFHRHEMLLKVIFIKSFGELFESTSENVLSLFCNETYFVSFQADMELLDQSFFDRSIIAFKSVPNLFAISGRGIVPFKVESKFRKIVRKFIKFLYLPKKTFTSSKSLISLGPFIPYSDYFGDISNYPSTKMRYSGNELETVFVGEAIIRGPIIWQNEIFRSLSGYNDIAFPLGRDECDLSFRAAKNGYVVGFLPAYCYSNPQNGTSRKPRSPNVVDALNLRNKIAEKYPGELTHFWSRTSLKNTYKIEIRNRKFKLKLN